MSHIEERKNNVVAQNSIFRETLAKERKAFRLRCVMKRLSACSTRQTLQLALISNMAHVYTWLSQGGFHVESREDEYSSSEAMSCCERRDAA